MINFGPVPIGAVLPVFFSSYAGSTGASVTLTGLAVTDIEIYKGTSMTQRASDAGYTLLDSDGIDVDGTTGIHAFSIDTGDNTDASFFAAGSFYTVIVSAVTVDSQTVNFIAATFRLVPAESSSGVPKVDVSHFGGSAGTFASGRPEVNTTHAAGTAWASGAITAASIAADAITAAKIADGAIDAATFAAGAINAAAIASDAITAAKIADGAIDAATFASGALDAVWSTAARTLTALDEDSTTLDLDATIRAAVGLASANLDTQLAAIDDYIDTEVAAIKATTDKLDGMVELTSDGYIFKTTALAQVWDETLAAHLISGSTGQALNAAGAAGDPWTTALPGAYSAGQAGYIVGTNLDATISSRASQTSLDTLDNYVDTEVAAIKAKTDNLPASPAATGDIPSAASIADAVWDEAVSGHTSSGTFGKALDDTDDRGARTVVRGTVTTGASTTSIPTSAFSPAGGAADQFKGRIVVFDNDTATAALRGQATDITASSNSSTPTLTVTALTTAPSSGDTFSVL